MARTMPCDVSHGNTLTSAEAAAERLVASCLVDGPVGGVGLEVEAHCFVLADPQRRPGWDELTDRRCFVTTRLRENVLLQAKVCQSGNGGPAVNVLAGAMQNTLGQ